MAAKKKTTEEIQDQTPEARDATEAMTADSGETKQTAVEQEGAYGKAEEPEVQKTASDPEEDVADAAPEGTGPKLESLSVLADRHRVVGWQQAAILRYMGWEDDKRVSDTEYRAALDHLKSRRIGGGRR